MCEKNFECEKMTSDEFFNFINDSLLEKAFNSPLSYKVARCRHCSACLQHDCGNCIACLDKPKFGGRGIRKQGCLHRAECTEVANNIHILISAEKNINVLISAAKFVTNMVG